MERRWGLRGLIESWHKISKSKTQNPNKISNPKLKKFLDFGLGALFDIWILSFGFLCEGLSICGLIRNLLWLVLPF